MVRKFKGSTLSFLVHSASARYGEVFAASKDDTNTENESGAACAIIVGGLRVTE